MAALQFSDYAIESIRKLPPDETLIANLWSELERIADNVIDTTLFPAPAPYRRDRRFAGFILEDGRGQRWGFSVTLSTSGEIVTIHTVASNAKAGEYPTG